MRRKRWRPAIDYVPRQRPQVLHGPREVVLAKMISVRLVFVVEIYHVTASGQQLGLKGYVLILDWWRPRLYHCLMERLQALEQLFRSHDSDIDDGIPGQLKNLPMLVRCEIATCKNYTHLVAKL